MPTVCDLPARWKGTTSEDYIQLRKNIVIGASGERVIWMVIMISALICSVSLVWITFSRYYLAPLVTTQMPEGVSVSKIIFPAVGICTNNRISKRAIVELARKLLQEERNKNYTEKQMLSLLLGLGLLYNQKSMDETQNQSMKLHRALGDYDVNELMRNLTPRCEDLLMRCAWNEMTMNCSHLFDFRLTMNGYCCTFNYLRQSDITFEDKDNGTRSMDMYKFGNKSNFDVDQGLKVLMKLNESDDFYYNMPIRGAQLQFSDAYDFPDAPSGSFSMQIINPNVQMTVLVTASFTEASRDIQHVPAKLRRCLFYDESSYLPFYTYSDCLLKCRMLFLLAKCKCTPFNMPKMVDKRTCDMRDVPCLRMYSAQSLTVRPDVDPIPPELELDMVGGGIPCPMCYPSCSKTAYNYDFTNVKIYPEYLNSIPANDRVLWLQGANFTGTSIVHVKYAREVADRYGQNIIMKWFDLISIKSLPETTSIHGFRFIADVKRHWIERLFWLCLVILSWFGASLLIGAQYRAFRYKPISFVVETTYKDWNTLFPSIAVCENDNAVKIANVSDCLWGPDHEFDMEEVLKEISYFKGITYYVTEYCGGDNPSEECFTNNLTYYASLLRHSCQDAMSNCSWNDKSFDCCTFFRPMETEFGICFVINSIQGSEKNPPKYEMISNRTSRLGMIKFHVTIPVKVFIINEEEVPSLTSLSSNVLPVTLDLNHRRLITVRNIENDADARYISPDKRKCRYIDENILEVYPYYSYTACTVQCRKDAQRRLCNCSNFFMPNTPEEEKCNTSGVICMNQHSDDITVLKASWSKNKGLYCDCLPSCTESEISVVKDIKEPNVRKYSTVQIELSSLPCERYRRNVVRGVLDLVVSTGGTGGLFLGASILSFVELLYILLIRPFCDVYNQRHDDPWHRKYGTRRIQDNKFALNRNGILEKTKFMK